MFVLGLVSIREMKIATSLLVEHATWKHGKNATVLGCSYCTNTYDQYDEYAKLQQHYQSHMTTEMGCSAILVKLLNAIGNTFCH
jgi:hypothetical protein